MSKRSIGWVLLSGLLLSCSPVSLAVSYQEAAASKLTTQAGATQAVTNGDDCAVNLMPSSDKIDEIWLETDLHGDTNIACKVKRIATMAPKLKRLVIILTPTKYDVADFCQNKNDGITNRLKWYQSNIITPLKKKISAVQFGLMPYSPKKFGSFKKPDSNISCNIWGVLSGSANEPTDTLNREAFAIKESKKYGFMFWATQQSYANYNQTDSFKAMVGDMSFERVVATSFSPSSPLVTAYDFGQAYNFFIPNSTIKPVGFSTKCIDSKNCPGASAQSGKQIGCDTALEPDWCRVNDGAVSSIYLLPYSNPAVSVTNIADYIYQLVLEKAGSTTNCTGIAVSGEYGPAFLGSWRGCVSGHTPLASNPDCDITNTFKAKFKDFFDSLSQNSVTHSSGCTVPVRMALWNIDNFLADPKPK